MLFIDMVEEHMTSEVAKDLLENSFEGMGCFFLHIFYLYYFPKQQIYL